MHAVIDDHSRVACAKIHDDDTALTAVGALLRAISWFATRSVVVERVLSGDGGCYRPKLWTRTCEELAVTPPYTSPYGPQTNGRIERFHRTMAGEWAFARHCTYEAARRAALPG